MIFMAMLAIVIPASAALPIDSYTIKRDKLPEAAREMLDKHFPKAKISMIRVDRHLLRKTDYDVKLTNGTKIEFDNKGNWTSIDCKKREVPTDLVNKTVKRHVTNNRKVFPTFRLFFITLFCNFVPATFINKLTNEKIYCIIRGSCHSPERRSLCLQR